MRDRDKRRQDAAERSQAARSIADNEMIRTYFEEIRNQRIRQMIDAKAGDDETRRVSAIEINVIDGLWPVSYTHLDVYKRQGTSIRTVVEF